MLWSIELLAIGIHWNPSKTQTDSNIKVYYKQTDSGAPFMRTISTQLIERGEVELVLSWNFQSLHSNIIVAGVYAADYVKEI